MRRPDILTRINQFLLLLPNFHNEQPKKVEELKSSFDLLLEELLNDKLKMGNQIQMVQEENQEETNQIISKKRQYLSSLILSCLFPYANSGCFQNTNEKLFFYSLRYSSNQLCRGEETPLQILKEAISAIVDRNPEDGILEDFREPEPVDFLLPKDLPFEKEVRCDDQAQKEGLKNQREEGYFREGQNQLADFFSSDQGTGLDEKVFLNASYFSFLKDHLNLLFEKDLFSKEEEYFHDDSKDNVYKAFIANESTKGHTVESFTNLQAGQARTTSFKEEEIASIISRIRLLKEEGQTEIQMELDLEQLGKLMVKITKEDGELQTDFLAESLEAKELIESNISALRDALLSLGFDSVNIKTSVQQGNNDFFSQERKKPSLAGIFYGSKEEIKDDKPLGEPSILWRGETLNLVA